MIVKENSVLFRYEEIAGHITKAIEDGTIHPGTKLPSLRIMSQRYNCAISVVTQAYELLERRGLTYAVEKSGFFASDPRKSPLPNPQKEKYLLNSEEAKPLSIISRIVEASNDHSILPLGAGIPHESLLPIKSLKQILLRIIRDEPHWLAEYCDEAGNRNLRSEIAGIMLNRGVSLSSRDILITNGCTEALSLAIQSCSSPGDVIVTESPVFPGIIQILDQLKRRVIPIPTSSEEGMDLKQLEKVLEKGEVKAVVMTALYQNPLGYVMKEEKRKEALRLTEEQGVTLIEDDIYNQCSFEPREERPIKSFDSRGNVIYCSSFSKTVSPGLRTGWLIGGKKHDQCRRLKMSLSLGGNPAVQQAVAEYLKSSRYGKNIHLLRRTMARQALEMKQLLIRHLPEGTAISDPKGGFYLWVELPGNPDCLVLFEKALENGISITPGPAFTTGQRYNNCIRISFAAPITDETRAGIVWLSKMI